GVRGGWISRGTQGLGIKVPLVDGLMEWETSGGLSTCGAAYVTRFEGAEGAERRVEDVDTRAPLQTSYAFRAHPGRVYVMRQLSSLLSSRLHSEPDRMAARLTFLAGTRGFDTLRRENQPASKDLCRAPPPPPPSP